MKWFKDTDFKCKCDCGMDVTEEVKELMDEARDLAGVPFNVTSGARCLEYNRSVPSRDTSSHVKGLAVDIKYADELYLTRMVHALSRVGIKRFGVNKEKKFIHVDIDNSKPDSVFGY